MGTVSISVFLVYKSGFLGRDFSSFSNYIAWNISFVNPISMVSPFLSGIGVLGGICLPFIRVPFVLFKSSTSQRPP